MKFLLAALALVAGAWAQDNYYCPDGWTLEEDQSGCRCFMLSPGESVTKDDADILCAFHEAWVAELDHPGIDYWLKEQLLANTEVGEFNQFWLGATTHGHHDPNHDNGMWTWTHMNKTVDWFDWGRGQPNDWHNENCLALMEYHDPFFPNQRNYYWNDWHCDEDTAHYICEKRCN